MNIFRNRDKSLDDLPGREEMPRPKLPEFDREMERVVQDRVLRKPSIPERRERLDAIMGDFAQYHDLARQAAQDYITEHAALIEDAAAEKAELQARMEHLDKIAAGMPTFGGKDEQMETHGTLTDRLPGTTHDNPVTGKDESGGRRQLSIADRRPKPIQT